ncbi:MAG: hypothetical protein V7L25_03290 [Nostoc sp.]|uniref:hypothetical protein n=1 Tax=Nostoc sp. TaxID=1180 RepID=UPI002FF0DADD
MLIGSSNIFEDVSTSRPTLQRSRWTEAATATPHPTETSQSMISQAIAVVALATI